MSSEMRKRFGQSLAVLLLAIGLFAIPRIYTAAAAGTLYVTPGSTAPLPVGSTFSVQVKVSGIDQFNGWEIQVASDRNVISPTSISTAGNAFTANTTGGIAFELRNCVNGTGKGCCLTSCSPLDGPGIADSAYGYTKMVSGAGLLFTVTFKVVSSGPFSTITIQNEAFSNGGTNGVVHTTVNGVYGSMNSITVTKFFTDGTSLLPLDSSGNPSVNVTLVNGTVKSTNPGQVFAWVNVTNAGMLQLDSLSLSDLLPIDWQVSPPWLPPQGGIHVYYANTSSLATNQEITDPPTITVSASNPQSVSVNIPNLSLTAIGHPLLPGQSILLSAKLAYGLKGTTQHFASYPRTYTGSASSTAWTQPSYAGTQATATGSASFVAHAKVLGDVNGDGKVNILDVGMVLAAYGSTPGSPNWNPNADFNNDGSAGIDDVSIVLQYFDTSS
jgi:dockerin type I repeat protein/cohesin domain-containing protein